MSAEDVMRDSLCTPDVVQLTVVNAVVVRHMIRCHSTESGRDPLYQQNNSN